MHREHRGRGKTYIFIHYMYNHHFNSLEKLSILGLIHGILTRLQLQTNKHSTLYRSESLQVLCVCNIVLYFCLVHNYGLRQNAHHHMHHAHHHHRHHQHHSPQRRPRVMLEIRGPRASSGEGFELNGQNGLNM